MEAGTCELKMIDDLSFDEWWKDFSYQFKNDKDGGFEFIRRLISEVRTFKVEKRIAFINELLQRDKLSYDACQLIPLFGNEAQIQEIKNRTRKIIDGKLTEDILPTYIKTIIQTFSPSDLPLLHKYYLNYQGNLDFRIPTELYTIDKTLFLQAFTIELANYPIEKICEYDGWLYLTNNIEAIEFLIKNLPYELSDKLKKFALAKSKHPWVIRDEKLKQQLLKLAGQE